MAECVRERPKQKQKKKKKKQEESKNDALSTIPIVTGEPTTSLQQIEKAHSDVVHRDLQIEDKADVKESFQPEVESSESKWKNDINIADDLEMQKGLQLTDDQALISTTELPTEPTESSLSVEPSVLIVEPSALIVEPSALIVEPSALIVEPSALIVEPSALIVEPSTLIVEPSTLIVEPSALIVEPSTLIVEPSALPPSIEGENCLDIVQSATTEQTTVVVEIPSNDHTYDTTEDIQTEENNDNVNTESQQELTTLQQDVSQESSVTNSQSTSGSTAEISTSSEQFQSVRLKNPAARSAGIYENVELNKYRQREKENTVAAEKRPVIRPRSTVILSNQRAKHLVEKRVSSIPKPQEIMAFTQEQLNYFYYNAELEQVEYFVDEFLKNSSKEEHEFYELVLFYYKSRKRLAEILDEMQTLQNKVEGDRAEAWTIKECSTEAVGTCACDVKVQQQKQYNQASFRKEVSTVITGNLFKIRDIAHKTLPLELYNNQVSRLRIENYLAKLFKASKALIELNSSLPISALLPANIDSQTIPVLCQLQDCIAALFVFKRYGVLEEAFSNDIDCWLSLLVAALQRIGTLPDSFFLMNHLLRCPPSTITSLSHFIQFPAFQTHHVGVSKWNSPLIHHFVVMLATLTLPVRSRKKFLKKFKMNIKNPNLNRGISWTHVDGHQEENENDEDSWSFMMEVDLISIFDQFPFRKLLIHLLNIDEMEDGSLNHTASRSSSNDVMSLFAFSSCLVNLLGKIFDTYNLLRYRQYLKCISRTIRLLTQVVSDHWLAYRNYRLNIIGDQLDACPANSDTTVPQFSLDKLQVEFDQIFLRASKRILSSHSSGAIQFLSTMPFEAIRLQSVWVMMNMILQQDIDLPTLLRTSGPDNILSVKFLNISPSEGIFLLTALSNMAVSRVNVEDKLLVETIAVQILEVSFLNTSLNGLYSKNGRDFLATIATKHPYVMSSLLNAVDFQRNELREVLTYIFEVLPLDTWIPTVNDMEKLRTWLLEYSVQTEENKLARLLLSKLNYNCEGYSNLFLSRTYHYAIAVLVVEAFAVSFPDFPGGIQKLEKSNEGIIAQVSKLAVSSYTKMMQSRVHTEFLAWGWDVLLGLKLHESDVFQQDSDAVERENEIDDVTNKQTKWMEQILSDFNAKKPYEFDVQQTAKLINVNLALKNNGLLASYVTFAMTKEGHFVDMFLEKGLNHMTTLNDWYQYDAVLKMLHGIVPVFLNCATRLVNDSFIQVMNKLVHVDVDKAGYTEKIWQYFIVGTYSQKLAALVTSQVLKSKWHSTDKAQKMINFWMFIFLKLPMWKRDCGVIFQIDSLCKTALTIPDGITIIEDVLYAEYKDLIESQEPRGLLSSVMSWISSNQHISLMPTSTSDFCYYASTVLSVEQRFENEVGLWKEFSFQLFMNQTISVEEAYKKCVSNLKSLYIPPLAQLSVYRCGEQAMVTPADHPFLPIIWKQFFMLFLKKFVTSESGGANRTGIGLRLFKGFALSSTLKKMKASLQNAASYHQDKIVTSDEIQTSCSGKQHHHSREFHDKLSVLYQGLSLWLEESRLHDPNLFIDSLPEVYIPELLVKVFQGDQAYWYSYVNIATIQQELDALSSLWSNSPSKTNIAKDRNDELVSQATCGQRIIKRLSGEGIPRLPPEVVRPQTPVDEPSLHIILTQPRLFQVINDDLQQIVQYAKSSSVLYASHVGLDTEFLEMLPDLYEMVNQEALLFIPCDGKKRTDGCKAPAQVIVRFTELRRRERVAQLLDDNRSASEQLLQNCRESFPQNLCLGTVHVDNIIAKLSEAFRSLDASRRADLQRSASQLFYLLAELIDDEVKRCYPAIQFFSTGVEVLGKAYIADTPSEQMRLLETILAHDSSVMFLAPHFYPMIALDQFVELYTKMVSFIRDDNLTTVFVLLSKFDVTTWLNARPPLAKTNALLSVVMKAIIGLGLQPNSEGLVVLEVLRTHMTSLLVSDINGCFSLVLTELLDGSTRASISVLCWADFLGVLDFDIDADTQSECVILMDHVKESLQYMASYFRNALESLNCELETFHKNWAPYAKSLVKLLQHLFQYSIRYSVETRGNKDSSVLEELWEHVVSVYKPLIIPQSFGKIWTLLRIEEISLLVQSFTDMIRLIIELWLNNGSGYCFLLNEVWNFYSQSVLPTVREEQSLDIFNAIFMTLPWVRYCPTFQEMEDVMKVYSNQRNVFDHYARLLVEVDWSTVVLSYANTDDDISISRFHHLLLNILFMLTTSNAVTDQTMSTKLSHLLHIASSFYWQSLTVDDTTYSCQWYAQTANSELLLDKDSMLCKALTLLTKVTGFHDQDARVPDEIHMRKRNVYVQTVITLFTRCSSLKNHTSDFEYVTRNLLMTIENTVNFNTQNTMRELVMHCCTFLSMLNNVSASEFVTTVKSTMESHLMSTSCAMTILAFVSAASTSLASLQEMISLIENAIGVHFVRLSDSQLKNSWVPVMQAFVVPELSKDEFVNEAIRQNALLTLYSFNLHRVSRATTQREQYDIMVDCVQWCSKPHLDENSEAKLLLLFLQIFDIVRCQLAQLQLTNEELRSLAKYMMFLSSSCQSQGEDKTFSGMLGAIGIGRKSNLSKEFRITAKSVHLFLTCQLPSALIPIRHTPESPGAIRNSSNKSTRPTTEAEKAYTAFKNLSKNKSYQPMREQIDWVIQYVSDPQTSIRDGCTLLAYLCKQFFYKHNFIAASVI